MRFTSQCASRRAAKQARARPSSAVKAPRRRKKGASIDPQGYDAGKKVTGRKRHILVDTLGRLLSVAVHSADIQDRDGVAFVLNTRGGLVACLTGRERSTTRTSSGRNPRSRPRFGLWRSLGLSTSNETTP
jgi:hypothetical protein